MVARLVDVAKRAGVAPSTVSYVLSGNRPISDETRERVERSMAELGFRIHAGARSIRRKSTNVIALVLPVTPEGQTEVLMQFVFAVLGAARARGMNVLLLTAEDGVSEINRVVGSAMVDGVIVMEVQEHDPRIALLKELGHPAVLIGTPPSPNDVVHVDFDFGAAGAACFDYLHELGHRHIGYLGHPLQVYTRETGYAMRALRGVLGAMQAHGSAPLWSAMEIDSMGAENGVSRLLVQDPELSAVIVYNERMLPMVVDRFKQLGRDIPGDISIVAICPEAEAAHLSPPIAHVPLPAPELGELAVTRLNELIRGEIVQTATLLEPKLSVRPSAAAPAA